jgi:hypothetical protein
VCSATNAIADRTSTPVSVAMILRQMADSRIDIAITIAEKLTAEGSMVSVRSRATRDV